MANPSKRAGTEGENWWLEKLRLIWPDIDRAKTNNPGNDFHGQPPGLAIEAKRTKSWLIPKWTRYLTDLHGDRWALVVSPRDRRLKSAPPDIVVLPADLAIELFHSADWEEIL